MSRAIAFLAGLGVGAQRETDRLRQQARDDERDQWAREDRAFLTSERQRAIDDRNALRDAAAPVPVEQAQLPGPPVDDATPMPSGYKVGARYFADQGAAQAEADKTRQGRIVSAILAQDPVRGEQFKAQLAQGQAADMDLKRKATELQKEGTLKLFGDILSGSDPQAAMAAFNSTGNLKLADLQAQPYEMDHPTLGRIQTARLKGRFADGTEFNIPDVHEAALVNYGLAQKYGLLANMQKIKSEDNFNNRRIDLMESSERRREAHEQRLEASADRAARAAEARALAPAQVTVKDMRDFAGDVHERVKTLFDPKDGKDDVDKARIAAAATEREALAMGVFRQNAMLGMPITAETALQAIELSSDRKNVRTLRGSDGNVYSTVEINGAPVIVKPPLRPKADGGQSSTPPTPPRPGGNSAAAMAAGGVVAAPRPTPPNPEMERAARIEELRKRLAVDDQIKAGGFGGMGARALEARTLWLSPAERNDVERELAVLQGGR